MGRGSGNLRLEVLELLSKEAGGCINESESGGQGLAEVKCRCHHPTGDTASQKPVRSEDGTCCQPALEVARSSRGDGRESQFQERGNWGKWFHSRQSGQLVNRKEDLALTT